MTRVDYRRHMALVVTATGAGANMVLAEARYCVNEAGDAAEFAVLVDDAWQRRGLGLRMIRALGDAATRAGIRWLHGSVLVDNEPMLALMDRCGFSVRPDRDEEELVQVEINLTAEPPNTMAPDGTAWPEKLQKAARSLFSVQFREELRIPTSLADPGVCRCAGRPRWSSTIGADSVRDASRLQGLGATSWPAIGNRR